MIVQDLPLEFVFGLSGLLGLCVGSFLNVVIYRTPKLLEQMATQTTSYINLSYPASHCPNCSSKLRFRDLFPVLSWFFLMRRCAHCNSPISFRYPAVELLNATLWLMCVFKWSVTWTALCWALCCSYLLVLAFIDWDANLLPDALTFPLIWIGLISSALGGTQITASDAIFGAAIGYSFLWVISSTFERITGRASMGGGDLKLLAAIGAWLGPTACINVALLASVIGSIIGYMLQKNLLLKDSRYVPFGPFLSSSALLLAFTDNFWLTI
jgi:leader peptidase (prepilin peptidase)/N-methyltransferase